MERCNIMCNRFYIVVDLFRILVLSDIHFGSWSHYICDYKSGLKKPVDCAKELLRELEVCLEAEGSPQPSYQSVVLNGDVTSLSEEAGFEATGHLIDGLIRAKYVDDLKDIILLPGNHDVRRDPKGKPLVQRERERIFRAQYRRLLGIKHGSAKHLGVLRLYRAERVALIGLDSCRLEGSDNPGIGYVGFDQLDSLIKRVEIAEEKYGPFRRIAFVHHHIDTPASVAPDWVTKPQEDRIFSFMADAKRIREALDVFRVDCLIHGHYHTPELSVLANQARRFGRVFSAGSTAGAVSRCTEKTRHFMILSFSATELRIDEYHKRGLGGEWTTNHETFGLENRSSMQLSEKLSAYRAYGTRNARSDLQLYGDWARAHSFFAGDAETMAAVKMRLKESMRWTEDPDRFDKGWQILSARLNSFAADSLSQFRSKLQGGNGITLEQYVFGILKSLA